MSIKIKDFVFEVNLKNTKQSHDKRIASSKECICGDCKEFNKNREKIFTNTLKTFLKRLGLDYKKEDYLTTFGEDLYEVNYYVSGEIIKKSKKAIKLSSSIKVEFEDEDLPNNFLPKGLFSPYFLIRVWIKR